MSEHFFIAGAQRSGTTYLHRILDEHPQIEMAKPVQPEPKFFLKADFDQYSYDDYLRMYFDPESGVKARGEKTTSYIEYEHAAERMVSWFPNAKIILMLRDPVKRAGSNYQFSRKNGFETLSLEEAIKGEEERRSQFDSARVSASPYAYLQRGKYIERYLNHVHPDNLIILIFEELVGHQPSISQLYDRLGVESSYVPESIGEYVNSSDMKTDELIPLELQAYMAHYFEDSTRALEAYLGRSITSWCR